MKYAAWGHLKGRLSNFAIKKGLTSFINPYAMTLLKEHPELVTEIDYWCIDGISLVNLFNRLYGLKLMRYSFDDSSIAPEVFKFAKNNDLKIAIVGTEENYIHKAVSVIERKYSLHVTYHRNGYFTSSDDRNICIETIQLNNIDIVVCGMGTPYQEQFLYDLKRLGWNGYGFTCGGYLHQLARKDKYYPDIFDKMNIRWVYRIIDEPKLYKRYLLIYPKFFVEHFFHRIFCSFKKKQ